MKAAREIKKRGFSVRNGNLSLMIAFAIIAALLVIVTFYSDRINKQYLLKSEELKNTNVLILEVEELAYRSGEIIICGNDYYRSNSTLFLNNYQKATNSIGIDTTAIKSFSKSYPSFKSDVDSLIRYALLLNQFGNKVILLKNQKQFRQLAILTNDKSTWKLYKEVNKLTLGIENQARQQLKKLESEQLQLSLRASFNDYLLAICFFVVILIVFLFLTREFNFRRKAELRLQELNNNLESKIALKTRELNQILERITDSFIALDNNWCFTYVNSKAGEIFNSSPQSLIGKNIWVEYPDSIDLPFYKVYHDALANQQYAYLEEYFEKLDIWFEKHIYPSPDGLSVFLRNITEKKKAEQQLINEIALSETVISSLPGIFYIINEDGYMLRWNKNLETVTGYTSAEIKTMRGRAFFDESETDRMIDMKEATLSGKPTEFKSDLKSKAGNKTSFYLTGRKLVYNDSYAMLGVGIDITDLRKAREQILTEKELSDSIINSLPGVFYLYDEMGKLLRWNKNFESVSGYSANEIKDMHPLDFFESRKRVLVESSIKAVFMNRSAEVETDFVNKKGVSTPYFLNGMVINYQNKRCLIGLGIDITARRVAEKLLKESEERYRAFFENSMDGILLTVKDGGILAANKAACEIFGMTEEEICNSGRDGMADMNDPRILPLIQERERNGKARGEITFKRKDGTLFPGEVSSAIFTSILGEARSSMIIRDITDRKKSEQEILKSQTHLRELSNHLQNIRENERTGIAREIHDVLGQQMTALKYDITWLKKKRATTEAQVDEKINSMNALIDETIQSIRKISSELRPRMLDDLGLNAAIEWYGHEFEKNTEIKCTINSNIEGINFDKLISITIYRMIQEALTNVARHSGANLVNIIINKQDAVLSIQVVDNGKGISNDEKANLHSLGLLGMNERAIMIGASIEISNLIEHGTSVLITVPLNL